MLENKMAEEEIAAMEREKVFDAIRDWLSLFGLCFFMRPLCPSLQFGVFLTVLCPTYPTLKLKATNAFWILRHQ